MSKILMLAGAIAGLGFATTPRRLRRRPHAQRQRLDAVEGLSRDRDRGVQEGEQGRHAQLRRRRLRQGPSGSGRHGGRLRRLGLALQGGRPGEDQGRRGPVLPDPARADHGQLQRRRRRQAPAVGRHDREDLPARHQEVERQGDRRGQPGREAARRRHRRRAPRRRLGHHAELHRVPERRRQGRLEAQERLDGGMAQRHPGRPGQRRRRPDREVDEGRDRLRRSVRREGLGPQVRQHQEPGRQVRGADHRRGVGGRRRHRGQEQPACSARSTPRATSRIPSPARPG